MADSSTHYPLLEQPARLGRLGSLLAGLILLGAACRGDRGPPPVLTTRDDGGRIEVEVLNATRRSGLARLGTRALREQGLDVVFYGNADTLLDSTLVLIRRGKAAAGRRVARALGTGRVEERPDTLRRVDVSVLLGIDFVPPPGPRP